MLGMRLWQLLQAHTSLTPLCAVLCTQHAHACRYQRWNDARKLWGLTTNRCRCVSLLCPAVRVCVHLSASLDSRLVVQNIRVKALCCQCFCHRYCRLHTAAATAAPNSGT